MSIFIILNFFFDSRVDNLGAKVRLDLHMNRLYTTMLRVFDLYMSLSNRYLLYWTFAHRDLSSRTWFIRFFYDVPQENAERIGRWKFEKGVEFNGNLDKYRIEHLFFNLSSYTDETDPFK
jgi:hypothetical protein